MKRDHDVIVAGGGLNGPVLALALAQSGLSVAVIDPMAEAQRADPGFDGRAYALALASVRLLRAVGLWGRVADHAQPILGIRVSDGRAGEGALSAPMGFDDGLLEEGPMGQMLEDRYLRAAVLAALHETPGIRVIEGAAVIDQEAAPGGIAVTLDSGAVLTAALLAGADGRRSGTAARAGIPRTGWGYGQTAVVCAVAHDRPHGGIAHQFFMPEGPLAILPLPGNRSSIVWSETDDRAADLMAMDDAAFLDALRPAFGSFLGEIALAGARFSYPLGLTLAERLVAPRVVLVGDAAHGVHPIAGQGLNAGLRDVAALAEVIETARRRGEDIGAPAVLDRYASWRRFDTATLAAATDTFNRLFSNDNPALRALRGLGLAVVEASPALKRGFVREAAGLTGDLPRLMQG